MDAHLNFMSLKTTSQACIVHSAGPGLVQLLVRPRHAGRHPGPAAVCRGGAAAPAGRPGRSPCRHWAAHAQQPAQPGKPDGHVCGATALRRDAAGGSLCSLSILARGTDRAAVAQGVKLHHLS